MCLVATVLNSTYLLKNGFHLRKKIMKTMWKLLRQSKIGHLVQKYAELIKTTHLIRVFYLFRLLNRILVVNNRILVVNKFGNFSELIN